MVTIAPFKAKAEVAIQEEEMKMKIKALEGFVSAIGSELYIFFRNSAIIEPINELDKA